MKWFATVPLEPPVLPINFRQLEALPDPAENEISVMQLQSILEAVRLGDPNLLLVVVILASILCLVVTSSRISFRRKSDARRMASTLANAIRHQLV
jgi:hypothetical protein